MTDRREQQERNAAWQAAQQWRERARQARPSAGMSGPRLILTWLLFGVMMVVGTVLGLIFLLVGWAMLPFLRHRMKKRAEQMRAQRAEDIGGAAGPTPQDRGQHEVLQGEYELKDEERER